MKIPEKAIKLSIEGGWNYTYFLAEGDGVETWLKLDAEKDWHKIALDKAFWIALGKNLGWNAEHEWEEGGWTYYAQVFYQLVLIGGNTAAFWRELLDENRE